MAAIIVLENSVSCCRGTGVAKTIPLFSQGLLQTTRTSDVPRSSGPLESVDIEVMFQRLCGVTHMVSLSCQNLLELLGLLEERCPQVADFFQSVNFAFQSSQISDLRKLFPSVESGQLHKQKDDYYAIPGYSLSEQPNYRLQETQPPQEKNPLEKRGMVDLTSEVLNSSNRPEIISLSHGQRSIPPEVALTTQCYSEVDQPPRGPPFFPSTVDSPSLYPSSLPAVIGDSSVLHQSNPSMGIQLAEESQLVNFIAPGDLSSDVPSTPCGRNDVVREMNVDDRQCLEDQQNRVT